MKKHDLPILVANHHDLTWRRCFHRPLEWKGEQYAAYDQLQELYILENLKFASEHPEYKFNIECVAILSTFLKNNPHRQEEIASLIKEGRIHIPFSGHNIVDSNMIQGESIVRNYLFGREYLKNKFNYFADGMDRMDAFGNSAQLPQIARGFGIKWMSGISYSNLDGDYWKGLDGSTVYSVSLATAGHNGGFYKYRPCPSCKGDPSIECPACNNERIDRAFMESKRGRFKVKEERIADYPEKAVFKIGGEEILPPAKIFDWIEENKDKYHIYFSDFCEMAHRYYQERIDQVDMAPADQLHSSSEANCNNTGCYVTRIQTKQRVRSAENRIYGLESLAVMNDRMGRAYPKEELTELWDELLFTMFHDAVTGTMVDAAYDELMEIHEEISARLKRLEQEQMVLCRREQEGIITVLNPWGQEIQGSFEVLLEKDEVLAEQGKGLAICGFSPLGEKMAVSFAIDLPPFGKKVLQIQKDASAFEQEIFSFEEKKEQAVALVLQNKDEKMDLEQSEELHTIENEYFRLIADGSGILEIYDKKLAKVVAKAGEYRIGEWILEHDEGSPWATLSPDRRRIPLGKTTILSEQIIAKDRQELIFKVKKTNWAYGIDGYDICYRVRLVRGVRRVEFLADVGWDCQSYRLTIAFPAASAGKGIYEIPYGYLERKPYEDDMVKERGTSNWAAANGDYPAMQWAGIEAEGFSLALFNKGTPCHCIKEDRIELTVLRAPTIATYLHEPNSYSMTDFYEMRDAGNHHFEYALCSYGNGFNANEAVLDGVSYLATPFCIEGEADLPAMPVGEGSGVRIVCCKNAEDGKGFIYRLAEYHGKEAKFTLSLPSEISAAEENDLKEEHLGTLLVENGKITLSFRPFEIKTIRFI